MVWIIFVMHVCVWIAGFIVPFNLGGLIHLLVVVALVAATVQFMIRRRL